MLMIIVGLAIAVLVLFCICQYKTHVIEDYEKRYPRTYQEFVDILNRLKFYLDFDERSSREPYMRGLINESICNYARRCRTGIEEVIIENEDKFATIKKN